MQRQAVKAVQAVPNGLSQQNRGKRRRILAALHPGKGEQAVHQRGQPDALLQNGVGGLFWGGEHPLLNALGIAADGHEGIAQLMGDILEKVLLHLVAALELAGHPVHGGAKLLQLPQGEGGGDFRKIPRADLLRLPAQPVQGAADAPGRHPQDTDGHQNEQAGDHQHQQTGLIDPGADGGDGAVGDQIPQAHGLGGDFIDPHQPGLPGGVCPLRGLCPRGQLPSLDGLGPRLRQRGGVLPLPLVSGIDHPKVRTQYHQAGPPAHAVGQRACLTEKVPHLFRGLLRRVRLPRETVLHQGQDILLQVR